MDGRRALNASYLNEFLATAAARLAIARPIQLDETGRWGAWIALNGQRAAIALRVQPGVGWLTLNSEPAAAGVRRQHPYLTALNTPCIFSTQLFLSNPAHLLMGIEADARSGWICMQLNRVDQWHALLQADGELEALEITIEMDNPPPDWEGQVTIWRA